MTQPSRLSPEALALLGAAILLAAGAVPASVRAACDGIASLSTTTLKGTWTFGFDTGMQGSPDNSSDVWWSMNNKTSRALIPFNGAKLAIMPNGTNFHLVDVEQLQMLRTYSNASVDGSDGTSKLLPGTVIAFRTYTGHYGKMLVQAIDLSQNHGLVMQWVVYKNCSCVATVASQGDTAIKGTWPFNFDEGFQGGATTSVDVWWRQDNITTRSLVPLNGAQLAVMPAGTDFSALTLAQLHTQVSYSSAPIDGSDGSSRLQPGTVVAYRTRSGRYGKMLVQGLDVTLGHGLVMQWLTFSNVCSCVCV